MLCKITDLITEVPEVGGIAPHFRAYLYEGECQPDVVINAERYDPSCYPVELPDDLLAYLESGRQFFSRLLLHNGCYLHSSAVAYEGKAYLFSAPSGTGKSTHTRLWQQILGEEAKVFNDDKTPMRLRDGTWYAYGAPWCGKDHININMKVPVAGICFLKQGPRNEIRRLCQAEAVTKIISQTIRKFKKAEDLDLLLSHVGKLVQKIPVFELENRPEPEAARLSYETMRKAAEESGL